MTFPEFAGEGLGRGWEEREEREEREEQEERERNSGGTGRAGEGGRSGRGTRESWRADCRRRLLEGGEKGGGLRSGHSGSSKVAGASRRTTMLYQGWLGVGFFKHSRGNCGVFREAV